MLKGKPQQQFQIGNRFIAGGTIIDLTYDELKRHPDIVLDYLDTPKPIEEKKLLTEDELFMLSRSEQIKLLNSFGIKDIPKVEVDRVKLILSVQK